MNRLALITGAVGGLGKAMALACARRGYDLFLTDLSAERLAIFAEGIRRQYPIQVIHQAADLTDASEIKRLWDLIEAESLVFDLLINVAGLDHEGEFLAVSAGQTAQIIQLNVLSVVQMTRQVLQHRREQGLHIINVASLAAFYPMPVKAVYAASKRFLLNFSLALAQELRRENVWITTLCPAGLPTNQACLDSIRAQGWAGRLTTVNINAVAYGCLERALHKRRLYIPGLPNQLLRAAGLLLPQPLLAWLIYRRWRRARSGSDFAGAGIDHLPVNL
jgi:hypothetical protein